MSEPANSRSDGGSRGDAVRVESLRKEFSGRAGSLVVLDDLSFALPRGETLSIVGPSGCGKSTLLHIIGTLDRPSGGDVTIEDTRPFELSGGELARFRNHSIGFVFQDHHLLPQLTVLENVLMPTLATGVSRIEGEPAADRAARLLDRVGLSEREHHVPAELSGGERQRAAVARSLIMRPPLVLCDEPTGNLDPKTADSVADLLLEVHREEGATFIVVTHSMELAARFDRQAKMDDGKLQIS